VEASSEMKYFKNILLLFIFFIPYIASSQSSDLFEIAVEVNDQVITNHEISQRLIMMQAFGAKSISKTEVINALINERLYSKSATELNILPTKSETEVELENFAKRGNLTKEKIFTYLKSRNVSELSFRAYINSGITQRKVIQKKFLNNINISQDEIDLAIETENLLTDEKSNIIEYITINSLDKKKRNKFFNSISMNIDNCLDLQTEVKKYETLNLQINKDSEINLNKNILDKIVNLDINETIIIKDLNNDAYFLMLCSRSPIIDKEFKEIVRKNIFNKRINKIGNAYIQELKGEAFINIR